MHPFRSPLPALVLLLGACTPAAGPAPEGPSPAYQEAVEVSNHTRERVEVKFYTTGGGPHFLGTLGAGQTQSFVLPRTGVGHVFVETGSGARLDRRSSLVRIRRYRMDRDG